jgi:hypothetical protein
MNKQTINTDTIYPPTKDQIIDLKTHNVGLAIRLSAKLGRPLEEWEYEIFRKESPAKVYQVIELSNDRFGIAAS